MAAAEALRKYDGHDSKVENCGSARRRSGARAPARHLSRGDRNSPPTTPPGWPNRRAAGRTFAAESAVSRDDRRLAEGHDQPRTLGIARQSDRDGPLRAIHPPQACQSGLPHQSGHPPAPKGYPQSHRYRVRALLRLGLNIPFYDAAQVRRVLALEPSKEMWSLAKESVRSAQFEVEHLEASAEEVPLADGSADTVVATYTLCTVPDLAVALREVRRVLKPGGALIFCEHGTAPDEDVRRWQDRLNPIWSKLSGGCNLNRPIPLADGGGWFQNPGDGYDVPAGLAPRELQLLGGQRSSFKEVRDDRRDISQGDRAGPSGAGRRVGGLRGRTDHLAGATGGSKLAGHAGAPSGR